jgi:hypothetical protein
MYSFEGGTGFLGQKVCGSGSTVHRKGCGSFECKSGPLGQNVPMLIRIDISGANYSTLYLPFNVHSIPENMAGFGWFGTMKIIDAEKRSY